MPLDLKIQPIWNYLFQIFHTCVFSMIDTYTDGMGFLDFQRSQHGSGMSSKSQAKKFIALLQRMSERTYNTLFSIQEMRQIAKVSSPIMIR